MALNNFKCNHLMPLHIKWLMMNLVAYYWRQSHDWRSAASAAGW